MNDTSVLATCLARLSWPPERLAREINRRCGNGTISSKAPYNWLKGSCPRRRLPYIIAKILSDHLGEPVTVEALWPEHFPSTAPQFRPAPAQQRLATPVQRPAALDPLTASVDWLVADEAVPPPSRSRGDEVPGVAVEMLTVRIQQLRQLDDSGSSGLVLDWALQDLQWAERLAAKYSYDASTGRRLHRIIAELGQLTAWLTADQGMDELSNSRFLSALGAARAAGDRPLAAYIISCMSYRAGWAGRAEEALRLIRIARKGSAQEDMGIGQALLATREARAHASLGDEAACQRALEDAAELSRTGRPSAEPPWAYWLTPGGHGRRRRPGLAGVGAAQAGGGASHPRDRHAPGKPAAQSAAAQRLAGRGATGALRARRRGGGRHGRAGPGRERQLAARPRAADGAPAALCAVRQCGGA
ncbi:hypothetical protein RB199_06665 [Streptomyces libani]